MSTSLTPNALELLFNEAEVKEPVLQVMKYRKFENGRYRVQLSDGIHFTTSAMFSAGPNEMIENEEIDTHSLIKIHRFMLNKINEAKSILIIIETSVVSKGDGIGQIGDPTSYEGRATSAAGNNGNASSVSQAEGDQSYQPSKPSSEKKPGVHPIAALTPYQNKWTICARVTSKSDIRTWSNSRGDGKLFSVNLLDSSGEIRATTFTDEVDRLFSIFEENKLYYITGGTLKPANKKYSSLKNDYEITFNSGSTVSPCHDDDSDIPKMQFEFVSIDQLEKVNNNDIVDVIGICTVCHDISTVQQKSTGRELKKRDLQIVDSTNSEVRLTLWGSQAENFDGSNNPVVAIKGVRVSDFSGRSLSVLSSSVLQINPDIKEAFKMRSWYDSIGSTSTAKSISSSGSGNSAGLGSNIKMLGEVSLENLGASGEAEYYSTKAAVNFIRQENCMYQACAGENCNKKIVDLNNGMYRCEKCNKDYDTFRWRLLLSVSIADSTDNTWVTLFQDQAETLLGHTGDQLAVLKESDQDAFSAVFQKALFKDYYFRLRVKMETWNDENRLKTTVASLSPLDPIEYTQFILTDIRKMLNSPN